MKRSLGALIVVVASTLAVACPSATRRGAGDGLDASRLPESVRSDYDLFALRCSKCHSLARPLQSGIEDDDFWAHYVTRMRRMPSSGISATDADAILRFLHFYSTTIHSKKEGSNDARTDATEPSARSSK